MKDWITQISFSGIKIGNTHKAQALMFFDISTSSLAIGPQRSTTKAEWQIKIIWSPTYIPDGYKINLAADNQLTTPAENAKKIISEFTI